MDGFEFGASIVKSVVWPSAVVFGLYLFRREIRPLLPYLRMRMQHKDTSVELSLSEATKTAKQIEAEQRVAVPSSSVSLPPPTEEEKKRFEELVAEDPRDAVLNSWSMVDEVINDFADTVGIESPSTLSKARWLRNKGIVGATTMDLFDSLRQVHSRTRLNSVPSPSPREARLFNQLAEFLARALETERSEWSRRNKSVRAAVSPR
jgi:hypothetical protein